MGVDSGVRPARSGVRDVVVTVAGRQRETRRDEAVRSGSGLQQEVEAVALGCEIEIDAAETGAGLDEGHQARRARREELVAEQQAEGAADSAPRLAVPPELG